MSGLRVKNRQDNNFTIVSSDSRVAAIIFSQGKNGVPDDDNANLLMKTFVYDGYVENEFDDKIVFGFTLIEMALVLIILGLLMGSLLFPLPKQIEQKRINITQQRLDEIKEALLGFAVLHNRLPCPASDENGLESTCNNEGNIPWRVLGVGRYDTWGNPFRYRVDSKYTVQLVPTDPLAPIPPNTSSGLVVQDTHLMTPIKLVAPESETTTSRVVAIIFYINLVT